jgi:uncharacterized protein (DUF433 family)
VKLSEEQQQKIQAYADENSLTLDEAFDQVFRRGVAVLRSQRVSDAIPPELKDFIVSDYHTVSGWARFKGTRMPLQVLVDNLREGMTPEEFLENYPSEISLEDIATVQDWLKTLPPWDGIDRENMPEAYRFMVQEERP